MAWRREFSRYQAGAGHSRMQTSAAKGSEHEMPENKAAEELLMALHCTAGQTRAETSDLSFSSSVGRYRRNKQVSAA